MSYEYVDTTQRVGALIVQVVADEASGGSNPRDNDNLAHIYGSHRRYTIGDGEPPTNEMRALERGGIRLLYRWLRRYQGLVAFTKLGMYDHSGVTFYAVPMGDDGHHAFDSAGWDSGIAGYAYVDAERLDYMGTDAADAERLMLAEIDEYDAWSRGDVWGYVVSQPCDNADHDSDAAIAACPHSKTLDSCWGYIGEPKYALEEGISIAEWHNAHAEGTVEPDTEED
jgi:hypothetical protein